MPRFILRSTLAERIESGMHKTENQINLKENQYDQ